MATITRRGMMLGAGTALALPQMPVFGASPTPPKRLVFINFGFGTSGSFYPDVNDTGASYAITDAMKPLEQHRNDFSFISNLSNLRSA